MIIALWISSVTLFTQDNAVALMVWGDWDHVIIHDEPWASQRCEHMCFLSHSSFHWDKQPRLIWKPLRFSFRASKGEASVWTSWLFVFCQSGFIPSRVKIFKVCHSQKLKSQLLKWMINWLHSIAPLCFYALLVCTCLAFAVKQRRGICYFPPLFLRVDPLLPCTSPQISGYYWLIS